MPDTALTFLAPALPSIAVDRPRLRAFLDVAVQQRMTVVVAPPGYGKTMLLTQWVARHPRERVRWITLRPEHNIGGVLAGDLVAALELGTVDPGGEQLDHPAARRRLFIRMLSDLERMPPTTLVLDDFQMLSAPELLEELAMLVERAPRTLRIVAATRTDPPLRYYRFRLADALIELRQENLAFTRDEAADLLVRVADRELTDDEIDALHERTEGWPVGLQLAALALRDQPDVGPFVETFAAGHRHVADYLTEEVLLRQSPDVRRFLLETSVLDRLSGSLCEHVTEHHRSHAMLEDLDRTSMFITPLDGRREWYRYHQLFRALLRHHLRDADPERERTLLLRAAEWHLSRGEVVVAVRYLADAGAWDAVLDSAFRHGATMFRRRRALEVVEWIRLVPPDVRVGRVDVALLEAAGLVFGGEATAALAVLDSIDVGTSRAAAVFAEVLRGQASLAAGSPRTALACSRRALEGITQLDDADLPDTVELLATRNDVIAASRVVRGVAHLYRGDHDEARAELEAVPQEVHGVWRATALATQALLDAWCGRLIVAEHLADAAIVVGDQLGLDDVSLLPARLALAVVARHHDELERAGALLDDVTDRASGGAPRVVAAWIALEEANFALAAGDPSAGLAVLARHSVADHPSMPATLRARRQAVEAQLRIALGDLDGAQVVLEEELAAGAFEVTSARVRLAIETGHLEDARSLVATWPESSDAPSSLEHRLWVSVLDHLEGDEPQAAKVLTDVITEAEAERDVGLLRSAGTHALGQLRAVYRTTPTAFLGSVVDRPAAEGRTRAVKELVEQITRGEYLVLSLLPTRLSNAEIADQLGVSLNTIKTHLKHIYRKLEVANRSEAVDAAERLHVL